MQCANQEPQCEHWFAARSRRSHASSRSSTVTWAQHRQYRDQPAYLRLDEMTPWRSECNRQLRDSSNELSEGCGDAGTSGGDLKTYEE